MGLREVIEAQQNNRRKYKGCTGVLCVIYIYVYIYIYIYTIIHMYIYTYIHTKRDALQAHISAYVCTYIYIHACQSVCVCMNGRALTLVAGLHGDILCIRQQKGCSASKTICSIRACNHVTVEDSCNPRAIAA